MDKNTTIAALNALFPTEMVGPGKGIGLTLLYRRRYVARALRAAQTPRAADAVARTCLLGQYGVGRVLWEQREALCALLEG
jgi:hypothetical protein